MGKTLQEHYRGHSEKTRLKNTLLESHVNIMHWECSLYI